jgi:TM2 domain-containing membrane protein YozV
MVTKSPGAAVLLSFLWCGLGQIYKGNIGKGVLLMMIYPICIVISWFGIFALIRAAPTTGPDSIAKLLIAVVAFSAAPAL